MIGPVQLIVVGYTKPYLAEPLRAKVAELKDDPAVRVIDVLCVHKNQDDTLEMERVGDLVPEGVHEPGEMISRLLTSAQAAKTMGKAPTTGEGFLFRGDVLPDPRGAIPAGSGVLAILLEHRWAIPLRDVVTEEEEVYPIADSWLGRDALKDVHLLPHEG